MTMVEDKGAWWIEGDQLHLDIPQLLKNCGLADTEANRDLAVKTVLEAAADMLPRSPCMVIEQGAAE